MSRRLRWVALACAASIVVLLAGCSSNNPSYNDSPVITSLFPSSATAGGAAFTLNVAGTGFISTSVVYWNNSMRATTYNTTTTELSVSITAQDIATAGAAQVTVVTPAPGGGISTAANFTINSPQNPTPTISSLAPASTPVGTLPPGGVLTITGTNFVSSSSVAFNGIARTPTSVNSAGTQIIVPVLAADVAANATIQITVSNPAPGGGVSSALPFTVGTGGSARLKASAALGSAGQLPELVSISPLGGPLTGGSGAPAVSSDGRFVAFYSGGTSLFSESAFGNVFLRDTCIGATGCSPQTIAIDLAPDAPAQPQIAISADGRFVVFVSPASNLVPSSQPAASESPVSPVSPVSNIYVRDLCTGAAAPPACAPSTALVSVDAAGTVSQSSSGSPSISADGRFIAFTSTAQNLAAPSSASGTVLYVRDTCAGPSAAPSCVPQTLSALMGQESQLAGAQPANPSISATGRYIAFEALPLVPEAGSATEASDSQIFVEDTCLGADSPAGCIRSLAAVSIGADGSELAGANQSPSISADGRFVAFASTSSGESPGAFLRDTCNGAAQGCIQSTILLAQGAAAPSISGSGRYVSFINVSSSGASPVTTATAGVLSVYDTCFGTSAPCTPQAYPISSTDMSSPFVISASPAPLSSDGSIIVFATSTLNSRRPISGRLSDVLLTITPF